MSIKSLIAFTLFQGCTTFLMAQHYTEHQYAASEAVFNNPERGFYKYTSRGSADATLSKSTLENYYNNGFTLIYRIYYMSDYVDRPISQAYLDRIREDFQTIRKSGIKVVLRFAYTQRDRQPYGDAKPEQVQEHIAQLKPLLQENADVIAVLQAGFIGAWGEWYYTDYFSTTNPGNITAEDLQERADMVYALLDALPASRQIQLRTPGYKMDFFGNDPISAAEAYSGNMKSRIAHHNDCFVSSSSDVGTYQTANDRTYLQADSKYTAVGGETCAWYQPKSNCDSALAEMARYHWSFINTDYFGNTIQNWKDNGCFEIMQRNLGYRYEMVSSSLQDSSRQKGTFHGSIQIVNNGFSNPYNPRAVELVMRNKVTNKEYFLPLRTDIRQNPPGNNFTLEFEGGIPPEAENGRYDLFLNLPDPMTSLRNDLRYSIRLANDNTWEELTGYNRLFHTLVIHPSSSVPDYQGTVFFYGTDRYKMPVYPLLTIDGRSTDWTGLSQACTVPGNQHAVTVKICNDYNFLYFLASGPALYPNSRLFIDADNNPGTGGDIAVWQADGADYMVENHSLYAYSGADGSNIWSWKYLAPVLTTANDSVIEMAIGMDLLDIPTDTIRYGYQNGTFGAADYLPGKTAPILKYIIDGFIDYTPEVYSTHYAGNAILYWGIRENDNRFRIIERSDGNENNFSTIAVLSPGVVTICDRDLPAGETIFYRSYLTDFQTVTSVTPTISLVAGTDTFRYNEITTDGHTEDWNAVEPILSASATCTYFYRIFADTGSLNFLVTGNQVSSLELYLETDDNTATGSTILPWEITGIDYRISADSLFRFQQEWQYSGKLTNYVFTDSIIELSIPFDDLSLGDRTKIRTGIILYTGSGTSFLPFTGQPFPLYDRVPPTGPPANFHLVSSSTDPASKIILRWDKCNNCNGHIIEKSAGGTGLFEFLTEMDNKGYQYIDDSLQNHSTYSYRMYSYNIAGRSDYTRVLTSSTHDLGISNQESDNLYAVFTDNASGNLIIRIMDPVLDLSAVSLYDFSGKRVFFSGCSRRGEQEIIIPLREMTAGLYLLRLDFRQMTSSRKVLIY